MSLFSNNVKILAICMSTLVFVNSARSDPMTVDQARTLLTPYLQAPDTTFRTDVAIDTSVEGHYVYQFTGNAFGDYRINSVTSDKSIQYIPQTTLAGGVQPTTTLTSAQLTQRAIDYVASHYPNYTPGMFTVTSGDIEAQYDANEYYVKFTRMSPSGASLPQSCLVVLEEDTGSVKAYDERSIVAIINTVPAVTQAQAIAIGSAWIAANITSDPAARDLNAPRDLYPINLVVAIDAFLNQALIYKVPYEALELWIDAQTGAVIGSDGWAGLPAISQGLRAKRISSAESLLQVVLPSNGLAMHHGGVQYHDRTYLWSKQAIDIGIKITLQAGKVVVSNNGKRVTLKITAKRPTTESPVAWLRKGTLYIPTSVLVQLSKQIKVDQANRKVILTPRYMVQTSVTKH